MSCRALPGGAKVQASRILQAFESGRGEVLEVELEQVRAGCGIRASAAEEEQWELLELVAGYIRCGLADAKNFQMPRPFTLEVCLQLLEHLAGVRCYEGILTPEAGWASESSSWPGERTASTRKAFRAPALTM